MMKLFFTILIFNFCTFNNNAQEIENLYAKDGVLLGNKSELTTQCAKTIDVKSNISFNEKYRVCECNLELISKFYTSKEIIELIKSGKSPYTEIYNSKNPEIRKDFEECSAKYLEILDPKQNLTTMTKNFSENFIIACEYNLNNDSEIDKSKIDIDKYCECLNNECVKKGISISDIKDFEDKNSIAYNEILQRCVNTAGVIKRTKIETNSDDIKGVNKVGIVDIINNGASYKVKISIGNISKYFIIDSGATDSSISSDFERELLLEGIIKRESYLDDKYYTLADGTIIKCRVLLLDNIKIGEFTVKNVIFSVTDNGTDLLLGKSLLNKFTKWTISNEKHNLYLEK